MKFDKQARGKTRKKYGRAVRRFAALVRWGSLVLGVLVGLMVVFGFAAGSMMSVLEETGAPTTSFYSQVGEDTVDLEDASVGIIGGADGPTELIVASTAEFADTSAMVGGIVAGVIYALIVIVLGWMGSSVLYGFAEVIYCQEEIVAQNTKQIKLLEKIAGMSGYDEE